jgi:hypothetical protein
MKKIVLLTFIFLFSSFLEVNGQEFYASGGMGYNFVTMEKLNDYLHYNWGFNNRRDESHSAIEFYGLVGTNFLPNVSIETSFGYSLNSFTNNFGLGIYQFDYSFYIPELSILYDLNYGLYGLQAGIGFSYILGAVNETQPMTIQKITEETKGFAFNIKSIFYTSLSYALQVELGINYRLAFLNELSFNNFLINRQPYEPLNLSFNSFGIKIGMRYRF